MVDRHALSFSSVFAAIAMCRLFHSRASLAAKLLIAGILSMPALHALVRRHWLLESTALAAPGGIQLCDLPVEHACIGLAKGVLSTILPSWEGHSRIVYCGRSSAVL